MNGRAPRVDRPLVFASGVYRFDILVSVLGAWAGRILSPRAAAWFDRHIGDPLGYWGHVRRALMERGFVLYETSVSFGAGVRRRARDLRDELMGILARGGHAQANLIAHSMGGVDARHMIVEEGMADAVASLVTFGGPHLGTSYADWGLAQRSRLDAALGQVRRMGLDLTGYRDLTTERCRKFNARAEATEATNGVTYITVAGAQERRDRVFPPLRRAWNVLQEREGINDGLVSVASQRWTDRLRGPGAEKRVEQIAFPVPTDHLNQIAWWHPWVDPAQPRRAFEQTTRDVYVRIAEDLRDRGLYG